MPLRQMLLAALWAGALGFAALGAFSLLPDIHWTAETLSNLRVQFAAAGGGLALAALALRGRWLGLAVLAMAAAHGFLASNAAQLPKAPEAPPGASLLRVMTVNIDFTGHDEAALIARIRAAAPDVLVLVETFPETRTRIADQSGDFPYRAETGIDVRGVTIASRLPIGETRVQSTSYVAHILSTELALSAEPGAARVLLVATHPLAPLRGWAHRERVRCLEHLAEIAADSELPVIIAGDLNLTAHSPLFGALLRAGGLMDTARARVPQTTWMSRLPPLGLRIDHVLVGDGIAVARREVLDAFGSDHRALVVDLALADED